MLVFLCLKHIAVNFGNRFTLNNSGGLESNKKKSFSSKPIFNVKVIVLILKFEIVSILVCVLNNEIASPIFDILQHPVKLTKIFFFPINEYVNSPFFKIITDPAL